MNYKRPEIACFFLVGLLIFISVFYLIGLDKIFYQLKRLNLLFYLLGVGCIFTTIFFWSMRWAVFVKERNKQVSTLGLFKNLLVGLAVNNLTPVAKLGGEPVRAYLLKKKYKIRMRDGFATIISELSMDFAISIPIVICSVFLFMTFMNPPIWIYGALSVFMILVALGLAGMVGIYSKCGFLVKLIRKIINKIDRLRPYGERIIEVYGDFQEAFRRNLRNKWMLLKGLTISLLMKMFAILKYHFIFKALGFEITLIEILIVMGISYMLLTIPATPGNLGIMEGGLTATLVLLGIPTGVAAAAVFLERLIWFWAVTAIGGSLGAWYGVKLFKSGSLKKRSKSF
ncbi:hypothetical protein AKJ43_02885 [candidate division MSBL1 archaeon SCGC-AAA261D19]|uniref:Flippase-like domain-containing protein n=1 Tax=candidate division MSBL1 archaeon SCGC-AAA261D19 TaxID=1698273 RepID=A0A133V646_9EURY|nr:hypothetical protein AKJ43_02885 [candidate division MSBL1 archaeon SCGC-AAA261D19]